jgi:DNA-binding NtrC family response regulator
MANILVVDDELGIRDLLWEILNDEGHTVELAENASQARLARNRGRPDLVLLDIWMPDTDGVTLLKEWVGVGQQKLLKAVENGLARDAGKIASVGVRASLGELTLENAMTGGQMLARPLDTGPVANQSFNLDKPLRDARDEFEKAYFEFHLTKEGGSMTRIAEKTGLERTHLYRKLKQLGIDLTRSKRGGN